MFIHNKIPGWVNEERFVDILKNTVIDFKSINFFKVSPALGDGENYNSNVLKVEVEVERQEASVARLSFILKIPFQSCDNDDANTPDFDLFSVEKDMYQNIVPELEQIYSDIAGVDVKFSAKCYHFKTKPQCEYILMEDLHDKGFRNQSRFIGLDEIQTKQVLAKLARWHAASAKRVEIKGVYDSSFQDSYFGEENAAMIVTMNEAFNKPFFECLDSDSYAGLDEYKAIIKRYCQQLDDLYVKFGKVNPKHFNVLNHGDFSINNLMLQYDTTSDKLNDVYFIDYQFPKYGTAAQDMHCLFMTSVKWDIKLAKFQSLVDYYYERLIEQLNILQYSKVLPTIQELHESLRVNGMWAFVCAQRLLAVAMLDPQENANIETLMSNSKEALEFKKRMFLNPRYIKQIEHIIPWLIHGGYMNAV